MIIADESTTITGQRYAFCEIEDTASISRFVAYDRLDIDHQKP